MVRILARLVLAFQKQPNDEPNKSNCSKKFQKGTREQEGKDNGTILIEDCEVAMYEWKQVVNFSQSKLTREKKRKLASSLYI